MTDAKPYKVTWRSAIDADQSAAREEAFETEEAARAFVNLTNKSRHRTVLRTVGFEVSAGPTLVPINEFEWTDDYSFMRTLTCINHQTARYSTKNPFFRRLICTKLPEGDIERSDTGECLCPVSDLVVVVTGK